MTLIGFDRTPCQCCNDTPSWSIEKVWRPDIIKCGKAMVSERPSLPRSAVWCLTFVAWFSPQKRPPRYQKLINPCFSLPKAKKTSKSSTRKSKPKAVTTQMKALDQYILMVLFVPSVKRVHFLAFSIQQRNFSCSVKRVPVFYLCSCGTSFHHSRVQTTLYQRVPFENNAWLVLQTTLFSRTFSYVLSLELSHVECLVFLWQVHEH